MHIEVVFTWLTLILWGYKINWEMSLSVTFPTQGVGNYVCILGPGDTAEFGGVHNSKRTKD